MTTKQVPNLKSAIAKVRREWPAYIAEFHAIMMDSDERQAWREGRLIVPASPFEIEDGLCLPEMDGGLKVVSRHDYESEMHRRRQAGFPKIKSD